MIAMPNPVTAEQLLERPSLGLRCELVRGQLRSRELGGAAEGLIGARLIASVGGFARALDLGCVLNAGTGFVLARDPDTVRAPDAAFMSKTRLKVSPVTTKYFEGPPDLAVEVASPDDAYTEAHEKVEEWLASGTPYVVVIDLRRQVLTRS